MCCSENDNKPSFGREMVEVTVKENGERRYQVAFEGALDVDEGVNGAIDYDLDCTTTSRDNGGERRNCSSLFQLVVLSQSRSASQRDQLLLKSVASLDNEDVYDVTVHASDCQPAAKCRARRLTSTMRIRLTIDTQPAQLRFSSTKYQFVVKMHKPLNNGDRLGQVHAQPVTTTTTTMRSRAHAIGYRIVNATNNGIGIDAVTGHLVLLNDRVLLDQDVVSVRVECFYTHDQSGFSATSDVFIYFRALDRVANVSLSYANASASVSSMQTSGNKVWLQASLVSAGETVVSVGVQPWYYVSDRYLLRLDTYRSVFTLESWQTNNYSLRIVDTSLLSSSSYSLRVSVQHELTRQWLSPVVIDVVVVRASESMLCVEDAVYDAFDATKTTWAGQVRVVTNNDRVANESDVLDVDGCQMVFVNKTVVLSDYLVCPSSSSGVCYNMTWATASEVSERGVGVLFVLRPVEMVIVAVSSVFVLATLALLVIICRLRGRNACVRVKNYLFYGKKYGLSHAQRLSTAKMTVSEGGVAMLIGGLCVCLATCAFDRGTRVSVTVDGISETK